jgi:hypothetical protein
MRGVRKTVTTLDRAGRWIIVMWVAIATYWVTFVLALVAVAEQGAWAMLAMPAAAGVIVVGAMARAWRLLLSDVDAERLDVADY